MGEMGCYVCLYANKCSHGKQMTERAKRLWGKLAKFAFICLYVCLFLLNTEDKIIDIRWILDEVGTNSDTIILRKLKQTKKT